jgi:hypothetical protein
MDAHRLTKAAEVSEVEEVLDPFEDFDLSSLGLELGEPTEATDRHTILIYGRHRVGKSTLAADIASVEGKYPVLWVAAEDGTTAFAGKYPKGRIKVVNVKTWKDIEALVLLLGKMDEAGEPVFKTVVFDTLGEIQEIIKRDYLKANKSSDFAMWAQIADNLVWMLSYFQHKDSSYNAIYIAHTEKVKDDNLGSVLLSPYFLGKKSIVDLPKIPDTIAYLAKVQNGDETARVLQLTSTERIDAGSRVEHRLPKQMVNPTMGEYFAYITGEKTPEEQ